MIGVGNRGAYVMRSVLEQPGVKVVALCDIKPDRLDKAASTAARDNPKTYRQWRDLSPENDAKALDFLAGITGLDWVISTGIVSHMAVEAGPDRARQVVDSHLDGLAALPCPVTLIADLDYRAVNRHGVVLDSANLLFGRAVPRSGLRWKWEVAPFGEEGRHTRRVHSVAAWPDWRHASIAP